MVRGCARAMTYVLFLFVLLVSAIVFAIARLLGSKISFDAVFEILGRHFVMLPVYVLTLGIWLGAAVFVVLFGLSVLNALGLFPAGGGVPVWHVFPLWLWLVLAGWCCGGLFNAYSWCKERLVKRRRRQPKSNSGRADC